MEKIDATAQYRISYGVYVLTVRDGGRDNGCIINTVTQITDSPKRISIAVNKANLTRDMISVSGEFNVSILTEKAGFDIFERFGFHSGRDTDKFKGFENVNRSDNGVYYLTEGANAFISAKVVDTVEFESHTLFIAEVTEAQTISDVPSATYAYYQSHIKPKPNEKKKVKGYVCTICGYVYEGEELPPDYVCPICKHGAEYFEPIE